MNTIHKTYEIKAPIAKVWQALTDPELINAWGAGPDAKMGAEEGAEFSLWGGDIHGKNTKVEPEKLLVQDWYGDSDWDEPSKVTFALSDDNGVTTVALTHENFPLDEDKSDIDSFASGWDDYYMEPIKQLLEK
jgi:uncharacterized protein YndB with AHSA1/START domain